MVIIPLIDPYAIHQDGKDKLTADWDAGAHDIKAATFSTGSYTFTIDETASLTDYMQDLVDDTTPQLGGDLDGQSLYDLVNVVDIGADGDITAGGDIITALSGAFSWGGNEYIKATSTTLKFYTSGLLQAELGGTGFNMQTNAITNVTTLAMAGNLTGVDRIYKGLGSEALPSDTFTGHTDTGWWLGAGGTMRASHDANEILEIRSTGLDVAGRIKSDTVTITASSDNLDVSGVNTVFINITSDIVLGGCTGGVLGQSVEFVYKGNYTNTVTFEDTEGVGDQDFYMHSRGDETFNGGGITMSCDGINWYDGGHGKHV